VLGIKLQISLFGANWYDFLWWPMEQEFMTNWYWRLKCSKIPLCVCAILAIPTVAALMGWLRCVDVNFNTCDKVVWQASRNLYGLVEFELVLSLVGGGSKEFAVRAQRPLSKRRCWVKMFYRNFLTIGIGKSIYLSLWSFWFSIFKHGKRYCCGQ